MEVNYTGFLLVANGTMLDPNFARSVVLICNHDEEGAFGLVINARMRHRMRDIIRPESALSSLDDPVFRGGPVQQSVLTILHTAGDVIPKSLLVTDGVYSGGDVDAVEELVESGELEQYQVRYFLGYSGWGPGQLENEMSHNSWFVTDADRSIIFHQNSDEMWAKVLESMGGHYKILSKMPPDPSLN